MKYSLRVTRGVNADGCLQRERKGKAWAMSDDTNVVTTVRVPKKVLDAANKVFHAVGMNYSTGVNVYLRQVAKQKRIPFALDATDGDVSEEKEL